MKKEASFRLFWEWERPDDAKSTYCKGVQYFLSFHTYKCTKHANLINSLYIKKIIKLDREKSL